MEDPVAWPARSPDLNPLNFHLWGHLKSIVYATWIENAEILQNRARLPTNSRNTRNDRESNQINDKTRAGLSSNARWSFRASLIKVIKTENSLYLINEDRQDIYLYDFLSLFLDVQSVETPCTYYDSFDSLAIL